MPYPVGLSFKTEFRSANLHGTIIDIAWTGAADLRLQYCRTRRETVSGAVTSCAHVARLRSAPGYNSCTSQASG
jgi:hypothetical protein